MDPNLKVAFEALSADATIWADASDAIQGARDTAVSIRVQRGAFSFAAMDLADKYAELSSHVVELLTQGVAETYQIAEALRDVRADFEKNEDLAASEYSRLWQPAQ